MATPVFTLPEYLLLGSGPGWGLGTAACVVENIEALWSPPVLRGSNLLVPGVAGQTPRRHVEDEIRFVWRCIIFGDFSQDGTPIADGRAGIRLNLREMAAAVAPPATAPYTSAVSYTGPDGGTATGAAIIRMGNIVMRTPHVAQVNLDVTIPSGVLTYA
jgi:hypothetical protein